MGITFVYAVIVMGGRFRLLPHPADILIEAEGETLEEAFEYAALGLFEAMTNTSSIERKETRSITAKGFDLQSLLYGWIEELLFYLDTEGLLFSEFHVKKIRRENEGYILEAEAIGEFYDPRRHESKVLVKAATYHLMEIKRTNKGYKVRFVVDI